MAGQNTIIIGLGHLLKGDLGVGYYILEALAQEGLANKADLIFLAEDIMKLDVLLFKKKKAFIINPVFLDANPGKVFCWDLNDFLKRYTFFKHIPTFNKIYDSLYLLNLIDALPKEITLITIAIKQQNKTTISSQILKAARTTIKIIKEKLDLKKEANTTRIYRIENLLEASNIVF